MQIDPKVKAQQKQQIQGLYDKYYGNRKKEGQMAKAKKVAVSVKVKSEIKKSKPARVTVSGIFLEVFAANASKKLTDEQIAKEVNAAAKDLGRGHIYVTKEIQVVRRKFNLGLLSGQADKPKVELEKFEPKKA